MKKSSPKIVYVNYCLVASKSGKYGGPFDTTVSQVRLLEELSGVVVSGVFHGDAPVVSGINMATHRVRHIFKMRSYFDVSSLQQVVALWKYAKSQLVHISFARGLGPFLFVLFCRMRGAVIVLQTHGMLTARTSAVLRIIDTLITKPLIPSRAILIALTVKEANSLVSWEKKLEGRIHVIGNPAIARLSPGEMPSFARSVGFIARLHPRKRAVDFVEAAKISNTRAEGIEYKIWGPDEGDLQRVKSTATGLNSFSYNGATDAEGVFAALRSIGVFALVSQGEPWGNVLVAALCLGKPVVISRSAELAELVAKYGAGYLVDDGDPNSIAVAVALALDPENYWRLSRSALSLADAEFSDVSVKSKLLRAYKAAGFTRRSSGGIK